MKKLNNSNFEHIQDVIKELDLSCKQDTSDFIEKLNEYWVSVVGKKISTFSKVADFTEKQILNVICSDSFVANELYFEKQNLLKYMNKNIENLGITIKDIKFNYTKWKEEK